MVRWFQCLMVVLMCVGTPGVAFAQDTDDFVFDEDDPLFAGEEEEEPPEEEEEEEEEDAGDTDEPDPLDASPDDFGSDDGLEFESEDDALEFEDEDPEDDEDLLGEDSSEDDVLAPGTDNVRIYRERQDSLKGVPGDEEVMAWDDYLREYPNSIFRERIEERIDALEDAAYRASVGGRSATSDAKDEELLFVSPMHMTNVNPRTRLQLGLEFGFGNPVYARPQIDFEYAILRNLSVHGGFWGRYGGMGLDVGARWAFVKSAKLKFIATLVADVRVNFNPLYFEARPQLAFGKIIGPVQILLTTGAAIETRANAGVGLIGGLHVSARLAQPVSLFVETDYYVRNLGRQGNPFAFDVVSVGLRLHPRLKKRTDDPLEVNASGNVPAASRYLQYYFGAVQLQGNYYFPSRK